MEAFFSNVPSYVLTQVQLAEVVKSAGNDGELTVKQGKDKENMSKLTTLNYLVGHSHILRCAAFYSYLILANFKSVFFSKLKTSLN